MIKLESNQFKHACPRNCYSACTMISTVENERIVHLNGDTTHPYTKGKLCAKGYSYIERNYHPDRLKFPYYQKVKGSGKFKQITWEMAYSLLTNELMNIYKRHHSFLPTALYKYSGNEGVQHFVAEQFFSSIGKTTRIVGAPCSSAGKDAINYDIGAFKVSDPSQIKEAKLIIIWGGNPAATNIHLIPILLEAKRRGTKIVVIDPLYTQTAELSDLYIQIRPSTDGAFANILLKELFDSNALDQQFIEEHSFGFKEFIEQIKEIEIQEYLRICDVPEEAKKILLTWLKEADAVTQIIGIGIQRHSNGGQNIRAILALGAAHGDIGKKGGGVFFTSGETKVFSNQLSSNTGQLDVNNRLIDMNDWIEQGLALAKQPPIEMMWISCRNPLTQEPHPQLNRSHLENIPFIVTVEQFMTPTAEMSNLILPTTTHFEETDIVTSYWHKEIALNEKATTPYYESRSEWNIMKELAVRLNEIEPNLCSFPIHSTEEEYLNSQFNDKVFELYGIRTISDLRKKEFTGSTHSKVAWEDKQFPTGTGKYQFYSPEAEQNGFPPMPLFVKGKSTTVDYPFWLITPHHPYALNSQFQFLNLDEVQEAHVEIHPKVAKELGIFDGEVVKVFNDQAAIEIKSVYSTQVPKDILMIYQGWYPDSQVNVNDLIPVLKTDMGNKISGAKGIAYYDAFVNISKLHCTF